MLTPHDAPAMFIRMVASKKNNNNKKVVFQFLLEANSFSGAPFFQKYGGRVLTAFFGGIIIDSPFFSSVA